MEAGKSILLVAQKSAAKDEPGAEDMYNTGTIANILQMLKLPDGTVKVLVEGTQRARIPAVNDLKTHYAADATPMAVTMYARPIEMSEMIEASWMRSRGKTASNRNNPTRLTSVNASKSAAAKAVRAFHGPGSCESSHATSTVAT
jgi:ATP-dependent Lon protease